MQAQDVRRERQLDVPVPAHPFPDLPQALLNELCEQVLSAYSAAPHGGVEIGMVLFGRRTGQNVRVQAWRPIPCSHLLGPRFILAPADEALIPEVLSTPDRDASLAGTEPVGWCCSHTRSELALLDREVDFHGRYFQKPGDLAVILKPRSPLRAEAAIFGCGYDGRLQGAERLRTVQLPGLEPKAPPIPAVSLNSVAENPVHLNNTATDAPIKPPPPREALVGMVRGWQMQRIGVLVCLLAILTVLVYALWREYPRPAPTPPTLAVTLKPTAAGLAMVWKSNLPENSTAKADILDESGPRTLNLTGSFEPSGVLLFPHHPGTVQAVLTIQSAGRTYTKRASYSDPVASEVVQPPPAPEPVAEPVVTPAKPVTHAKTTRRHKRRYRQ